jgi:hypothetical protein
MGFGLFNKIYLVFEEPFWNTEDDYIGITNADAKQRGFAYMFLSLFKATGKAILMASVAGDAAHRIEDGTATDEEIVEEAMAMLRKVRLNRQLAFVTCETVNLEPKRRSMIPFYWQMTLIPRESLLQHITS